MGKKSEKKAIKKERLVPLELTSEEIRGSLLKFIDSLTEVVNSVPMFKSVIDLKSVVYNPHDQVVEINKESFFVTYNSMVGEVHSSDKKKPTIIHYKEYLVEAHSASYSYEDGPQCDLVEIVKGRDVYSTIHQFLMGLVEDELGSTIEGICEAKSYADQMDMEQGYPADESDDDCEFDYSSDDEDAADTCGHCGGNNVRDCRQGEDEVIRTCPDCHSEQPPR
jgi:hypothetical protein